ncbi:MAG: hypothetical protein QXR45_14845 [Candidatus Bathyarchaeia archaeon]
MKKVLGHKRLQSTKVYINIEQVLFQTRNEEFNVRVAQTVEKKKSF